MELLSNALLLLNGPLNNFNPSIHSKEISAEAVLGNYCVSLFQNCILGGEFSYKRNRSPQGNSSQCKRLRGRIKLIYLR